MKQLMRSLLVPAVAGALYAGPALADPKVSTDAAEQRADAAQVLKADVQAPAEKAAPAAPEQTHARGQAQQKSGPYSGVASILNANKLQNGSIDRTTWTNGEVPKTVEGRDTDARMGFHIQTQAQMAAMNNGAEAAAENQASNQASHERSGSSSSAQKQSSMHVKPGDGTVDSMANVSDSCGKTKRCGKDGERLHFDAKVAQQLSGGSEKPADMGSAKSKSQAQQPNAEKPGQGLLLSQKSDQKLHLPTKLAAQEQKPGDMPSADSRTERSAPEARVDRFVSTREPGSLAAHHFSSEKMMRTPDKFYH